MRVNFDKNVHIQQLKESNWKKQGMSQNCFIEKIKLQFSPPGLSFMKQIIRSNSNPLYSLDNKRK